MSENIIYFYVPFHSRNEIQYLNQRLIMTLLNLKDLRSFLEEYFKDQKEEISRLNEKYRDERSFLIKTYCIEWPFERGNKRMRVIVFQDLPSPYPEQIYEQIKKYLKEKGIEADFRFWTSYEALKSIDPVRVLRN